MGGEGGENKRGKRRLVAKGFEGAALDRTESGHGRPRRHERGSAREARSGFGSIPFFITADGGSEGALSGRPAQSTSSPIGPSSREALQLSGGAESGLGACVRRSGPVGKSDGD